MGFWLERNSDSDSGAVHLICGGEDINNSLSLSFLEYAPCVRVRQRVRELSTLPVATLDVSSAHWYRSCKLQRLVTAV